MAAGCLGVLFLRRSGDFEKAFSQAAVWMLALTALLQVVALLARTEAWHLTIQGAGGTVRRRLLYRASSAQVLGSVFTGQLGVAARISALRRLCPGEAPCASTLVAAEFPIVAVEATLAALTSFTLVGPLNLPWWSPLPVIVVVLGAGSGLRRLALDKGRELYAGLRVLRCQSRGPRVVAWIVVAVCAQIARNWLLLNAVGAHASVFDAVAVLIAVVSLSQLPIGPSIGAAAAVLILGSHGVVVSAAAGLLLTVSGTIGGLCFIAWAVGDQLWTSFGTRGLAPG